MQRFPEYWNSMTAKESEMLNGVGPGWLPSVLHINTIWLLNVKQIANIHDFMYIRAKDIVEKFLADVIFFKNLRDRIRGAGFPEWLRIRRAVAYFDLVLKLGDMSVDFSVDLGKRRQEIIYCVRQLGLDTGTDNASCEELRVIINSIIEEHK